MEILTRDFGMVNITESDVIKFERNIFGFEEYSDFIIIYDDKLNGRFAWLQSVEEPELCFIIANSTQAVSGYAPKYPKEAEKVIGNGDYEYWFIMVVKEDLKESTVNLKSPIIINPENHKAMQIILEDNYPIRYKLFNGGKEQE